MIKFDPHDLWIGAQWYWNDRDEMGPAELSVYVCLVPCFPIRLTWTR